NNYGLKIDDQAGIGSVINDAIQTGAGLVDFGDKVVAPNINSIRYANQFSGADASAKISAAIADLPSTGGTVDARGLEGAQSITTNVSLSKPVQLLLGGATYSFSGSGAISISSCGSSVEGLGQSTILAPASGAYTTTMLTVSTGSCINYFSYGYSVALKSFRII